MNEPERLLLARKCDLYYTTYALRTAFNAILPVRTYHQVLKMVFLLNYGFLQNAILLYVTSVFIVPKLLPPIVSFNDAKNFIGIETCSSHNVREASEAASFLQMLLKDRLFGQHLVRDGLVREIYLHLDKPNPDEPLIISLHGSPGSGKSFTATLVAQALYHNGVSSSFVKFFTASYHFPDPKQIDKYKEYIQREVQKIVSGCPRSLFVFDEVDKLPEGLLDALYPFISHSGHNLDGIEYKKAIFLFLGNTGADAINLATLQHKKNRKDLKLSDFQTILSNEALTNAGGWYKSKIVETIRVRWFIPYLPMERRHVLECFRRLAKDHPDILFNEDDFEEMADQMVYWPLENKTFSTTGCKRAENILLHEIAAQKYEGLRLNRNAF